MPSIPKEFLAIPNGSTIGSQWTNRIGEFCRTEYHIGQQGAFSTVLSHLDGQPWMWIISRSYLTKVKLATIRYTTNINLNN